MNLSVKERLVILSLLPASGDITELRILRKLNDDLSFTEAEHKKYKFVISVGSCSWDDTAKESKDIPIGDRAKSIIVKSLQNLNNRHELKDDHVDIYTRFVEDNDAAI